MKKLNITLLFSIVMVWQVFAQTGTTCADPIIIDVETAPYSTSDNTGNYADTYDVTPCNGAFIAGNDVVYEFTITREGLLTGSIAGNQRASLYITDACMDAATACLDFTSVALGGSLTGVYLTPGTYYATVSSQVQGQNGQTVNYSVNLNLAVPSDSAYIEQFGFLEALAPATIDTTSKAVDVTVAQGTDPSNLVAFYQLSQGAIAKVNSVEQTSGVTPNDFSAPVEYWVIAANGVDSTMWTVNVTVATGPSSENDILLYSFPQETGAAIIDAVNHTVDIEVATGTDLTNLVADYIASPFATVDIAGTPQVSGTTANDFTNTVTYTITAEDGTAQDWNVTVTVAVPPPGTTCGNPIVLSGFPGLPVVDSTGNTADYANNVNATSCNAQFIIGNDVIHTFTLTEQGSISGSIAGQGAALFITDLCPDGAEACIAQAVPNAPTFTDVAVSPGTYFAIISSNFNNITTTYTFNLSFRGLNDSTDFGTFSFPEQTGLAVIDSTNRTIDIEVGNTADLATLVANFTLSTGAIAKVNDVEQTSGTTTNDFSAAVTYWIIAENQIDSADWTVSVTRAVAPSSETDILSYSFPEAAGPAAIDAVNHTVDIEVINGANLTNLVAEFTLSPLAMAEIGPTLQESGITTNDFTAPVVYTITAEDATTQNWIITVTEQAPPVGSLCTDPIIISNLETTPYSDTNNSTGYGDDLSITACGGNFLSGNDVVYQFAVAEDGYLSGSVAGTRSGLFISDACPDGTETCIASATGQTGGSFTEVAIPAGTYLAVVSSNQMNQTIDYVFNLSFRAPSDSALIIDYAFAEQTAPATIDTTNKTVDIEVANGTDLTNLTADFVLSGGAIAKVNDVIQASGVTTNDFSGSVTYWVIPENIVDSVQWTVNVTEQAVLSSENDFLTFSMAQEIAPATIDATNHAVDIEVAYGTDVTNLVATFSASTNATVAIGATAQESGITANNFTSPVTYTITAEDGTVQDWIVTVTVAPNTATDFLSYSVAQETGAATIDATSHTIDLEVAYGTDITKLVASFTLSPGATTEIASVTQVSAVTSNDFSNPVDYVVIAEDGVTQQTWAVTVTIAPNSAADILSYSFAEQTGPATINATGQTVSVEVVWDADLTNLVASFTLSAGASAEINSVAQISGSTSNDFSSSVDYTITAEDGTAATWTVSVNQAAAPSTENDFTSFSFAQQTSPAVIDANNHTVDIEVGSSTDVTSLVADFTISALATIDISGTPQVSGTTANDFTNPVTYTITAEDGTSQDWQVTVSLAASPSSENDILTFSLAEETGAAVIDAVNHTVDIEVANGTGVTALTPTFTISPLATIDIGGLTQESGVTPVDFTNPVTYTVTAEDGTAQDWVVSVSEAVSLSSEKEILSYSIPEETVPAVINSTNATINVQVAVATDVTNLVASLTVSPLATVTVGSIGQVSGSTVNDFTNPLTYRVTAEDGSVKDWTVTVVEEGTLSSENDILAFTFPEETGPATIDATNHTVDIEVATGTDLTNLTAGFSISVAASIDIVGVAQDSGVTVNDFSTPVTYTVIAEDGTAQDWIVSVTEQPQSSEKEITTFSFAEETGPATINSGAGTIDIEVANGTDLTSLVATFSISAKASIDIGGSPQVSSVTANDFSSAVTYTVTAENGSTKDWIVTVSEQSPALSSETDILTYSFTNQIGGSVIDANTHAIEVVMSEGTDLTALVATFTVSTGASADISGTPQVSGTTANNFSNPVTYTITAEDGTKQSWTVTVNEFITDINNLEQLTIKCYPNPVLEHLTIEMNNGTIDTYQLQVMDASGRVVKHQQADNTGQTKVLNVAGFESGIYFIRVVSKKDAIVKSFIKQ